MSRPALATHSLLHSFHHNPALPKHTFYFLASVAFSILNRPDEIPRIWRYALENVAIRGSEREEYVKRELAAGAGAGTKGEEGREESALVIHRKIREALLKSVAIGGLPVAINALAALKNATPPHLLAPPATTRRTSLHSPPAPLVTRGNAFFSTLYGKVTDRVMGNMTHSYDDLGVVAELLYAHVLSNTEVLGPRDTSLLVVAALVPQDVDPQLRGHVKGAVTNGATEEQVAAVRRLAEVCCGVAGRSVPGAKL